MKRSLIIIVLLGLFFAGLAAALIRTRLLPIAITAFTEYSIDYSNWDQSLRDNNVINDLSFFSKNYPVGLKSKEAIFRVHEISLFGAEKGFRANVYLYGTDFLIRSVQGLSSPQQKLPIILSERFDSIFFGLELKNKELHIYEMLISSPILKARGELRYAFDTGACEINIAFSVAEQAAGGLPNEIKKALAYETKEGWLGAEIRTRFKYRFRLP